MIYQYTDGVGGWIGKMWKYCDRGISDRVWGRSWSRCHSRHGSCQKGVRCVLVLKSVGCSERNRTGVQASLTLVNNGIHNRDIVVGVLF